MRKNKKRDKKKERGGADASPVFIKEKTKYWIAAILFFTISLFLVLGAFGLAGFVGNTTYTVLSSFFGTGYFLFPILFIALAIVLLRTVERPRLLLSVGIGTFLFVVSGLGILELIGLHGGFIGARISSPLLSLFDVYASLALLGAFFFVSILLVFDSTPSLRSIQWFTRIFRKKEDTGVGVPVAEFEASKPLKDSMPENGEALPGEEEKNGMPEEAPKISSLFSLAKKGSGASPSHMTPSFSFSEKPYSPPPLSLLDGDRGKPGVGDIKANANIIKRTLQTFGINVEMDEISVGPSITRYALKPAQGVKLSRIVGLQNDLSLALAAHPIRIEAPIPGKSLVGIEIPNNSRITVGLSTLLSEKDFSDETKPLLFSLGRSVTGKPYVGNLQKMPHLLIAGTTGSGKSVAIHTIVTSFLYRNAPEMLRFILIDPKRVELTLYNTIPHLLTPVITDAKKAILALKWAAREMDRRYDIFEAEKVRDIGSYHANIVHPAYEKPRTPKLLPDEKAPELPERMPYIVIIIDELADIMSSYPRELEAAIVRLAQMSRAVGIHLVLSTQRPSVDIITGLIKANIPARMAFQVSSQTDSRTILDMGGAEKLLGAGDMLYLSGEMSKPVRLQSAFISENEIKKVVDYLGDQSDGTPSDISFTEARENKSSIFDSLTEDDDGDVDDDLYEEARDIIIKTGKASTTFLQRKLRVGYARAARIMDILEEQGVIGPASGAKQRDVLIKDDEAGYGVSDNDNNNDNDTNEER